MAEPIFISRIEVRDGVVVSEMSMDSLSPYRRSDVRQIARQYPKATLISVVDRVYSTSQTRYSPADTEIIVIPATGGKYGKSRSVRVGYFAK